MLGGQKEELPLQLWNVNGKFTGFSLVCEAVVCQHSALSSVCVCVFSLPTCLSEHSIQLNYVKIHFDITATHFCWK